MFGHIRWPIRFFVFLEASFLPWGNPIDSALRMWILKPDYLSVKCWLYRLSWLTFGTPLIFSLSYLPTETPKKYKREDEKSS